MRKTTVAAVLLMLVFTPFVLMLRFWPAYAQVCADNVAAPVVFLFSRLTQHIPFPIAEVLVVAAAALLLCFLGRAIVHSVRARSCAALRGFGGALALCLACVFALYAVGWAPLTRVHPVSDRLPDAIYTAVDLNDHCEELAGKANALRKIVGGSQLPYRSGKVMRLAREAVQSVDFMPLRPALPKTARYPEWMRAMGIAGIYFPWTGEAIVSTLEADLALPFAACHELAHQCGIAREDEANLIAYLACMKGDGYFRYSGTLYALRYGLEALREADFSAWVAVRRELTDDVLRDLTAITGKPKSELDFADLFKENISEVFLRMGGQEGLNSYGRMTALLMAYQREAHS